jgi:TonB-linked SusC/RagA family outer membrane protein
VPNGQIDNSFGSSWGFGTTNLLKANKDFGDHNVNGVIGLEYGEGFSRSFNASGVNMPNGQASLSNSTAQAVGGHNYASRSWAWLAQAQYSYQGKYIASASVRYDETSRFAPKARGGYFPGASAAWIVNKEDFMQGISQVDLLKVRLGYGKTGNDAIENFLWQDIYSLTSQYQNVIAAILERQQNPNLGWEEAYMTSFGVDAELLGKINVTLDLYNITNKNLLLAVPLAPSTGFFEFMDNVGTVNNKGLELAIDATVYENRDLSWDLGFNIGFNKNKVVYLPNGEFRQGNQIVKEGQDIFTWNMPIWAGVDPEDGSPTWEKVLEDGTVEITKTYSEATFQNAGTSSPKFQGGVNTALTWKGLTLSATGAFVYGNTIYNYARVSMDSDGAYTDYNMVSHNNGLGWTRWQKPGDIATHPQPKMNGNNDAHQTSTRYLEDGSFFRLKNVTLSYDLPQAWMKKANMKGLRIYVSGDNLATVSKFSGMDPEIDTEYGRYDTNYPVAMTVVGGIQLTF